jgi:UDP-N-acetylmuramoylalanine--D-glutamate ligase
VALKRRIFEFQRADDLLVLNADDLVSREMAGSALGRVVWTALSGSLPGDGVTVEGESVVRRSDGGVTPLLAVEAIRLRGRHNVANVLAAAAVASELGASPEAIAAAAGAFSGVPHRLEPVATVRGVTYVNDSIATTPERTLAGLHSFTEPIVLLLGGRDKQLPLPELASEVIQRCRAVVTFGEAGPLYAAAIRTAGGARVIETSDVQAAVARAAEAAQAGDVVLFSPAGTSFDAYPNFEKRGEAFRAAVRALPGAEGGP